MSAPRHASRSASHRRYASTLLGLFGAVFLLLGWAPSYRADWLLENVLVLVLLPWLVLSYRRLRLSRISYTALFLFLCLHEVGAHYTYAEVPYDEWCRALFGRDFNSIFGWERNHFDRVVHFLYGLLVVYPVREVFLRVAVGPGARGAKGFWGYLFPLLVVMSTSLLFELIEWGAALLFGGDLGMAYLGTQGDVWDSHKDSLMATLGALLASVVIAGVHRSLERRERDGRADES